MFDNIAAYHCEYYRPAVDFKGDLLSLSYWYAVVSN